MTEKGSAVSNAILDDAPPLIRGRGVAKTYRAAEGEVESLKPLDFDIRSGEFVFCSDLCE